MAGFRDVDGEVRLADRRRQLGVVEVFDRRVLDFLAVRKGQGIVLGQRRAAMRIPASATADQAGDRRDSQRPQSACGTLRPPMRP